MKEEYASFYIKQFGFPSEPTGSYYCDSKFTQGVGRTFNDIESFDGEHCVYMMVYNGKVVKFGDSEDGKSRLNKQYISIKNVTNDRVRNFVKKNGELKIYVRRLQTVVIDEGFGPKKASIHSDFEKDLLNFYKEKIGQYPELNAHGK